MIRDRKMMNIFCDLIKSILSNNFALNELSSIEEKSDSNFPTYRLLIMKYTCFTKRNFSFLLSCHRHFIDRNRSRNCHLFHLSIISSFFTTIEIQIDKHVARSSCFAIKHR